MLADHDGIDHQRKFELCGGAGDGFDDGAIAQRSRLGGVGRDIFEHGVELLQDELRLQALDAIDAHRVLHGQQREDSLAVDSELVEGFEIGLNASPAAGIRAGDRQGDGPHEPSIAGWCRAGFSLQRASARIRSACEVWAG